MTAIERGEQRLSPPERTTREYFRQSFRFSQDSNSGQQLIFFWLAANGYLENLPITEDPPEYIQELAIPIKHKKFSDEKRRKTISDSWKLLYDVVNEGNPVFTEEQQDFLFLQMITADTIYQTKKRDGRKTRGTPQPDGPDDPHASTVRKYVILKARTGTPAFDRLLHEDLGALAAREIDLQRGSFGKLEKLKIAWEKAHENTPFLPPTYSAFAEESDRRIPHSRRPVQRAANQPGRQRLPRGFRG